MALLSLVSCVLPSLENQTRTQAHCQPEYCSGNECSSKEEGRLGNKDVDFTDFQTPKNYNLDAVIYAVTHPNGPGWIKLEGAYSEKDVEMARDLVIQYTNTDTYMKKLEEHDETDEVHNNYQGLVWALLNKGDVFAKFAQHPIILNVSEAILGQNAQLSSFASNTVLPGMKGQTPHLDYPYYRNFLPVNNPNILDSAPPLALNFVTLLTDFSEENGGTAVRSASHINPRYPEDPQEFFDNATQMTGKAGDMIIIHGAIQHCAMPNKSKLYRSGILQHMMPVYFKPFEDISGYVMDEVKDAASPQLRQLLSLDHTYPILKA